MRGTASVGVVMTIIRKSTTVNTAVIGRRLHRFTACLRREIPGPEENKKNETAAPIADRGGRFLG